MNFNLLSIFFIVLLYSCHMEEQPLKPRVKQTRSHPYKTDSIGRTPVRFFPEEVSTHIDKFNTSLSPDGLTIYYTATSQKLGISGIAYQTFKDGQYDSPEFVPFVSHDIPVADVQISPDGQQMMYATFKDYEGKAEGFNFNIWTSERKNEQWQDPKPIGTPISSSGNEFYPVMTNSKTLYFNSDKTGNADIYFSRFENGTYQEPIALPGNINTAGREADAYVARDESYMIFVRVDQADGYGNSDLYISFRTGENKWTDPVNMGAHINSDQIDGSPHVSPDGEYLIFTSGRYPKDLKEKAMKSYDAFKSIVSSSDNGSLNFYIVQLDLNDYR